MKHEIYWGMIERKNRPNVLLSYLSEHSVEQENKNQLIRDIWVDTEFPEVNKSVWDRLLKMYKPVTKNTAGELKIYRGHTPINSRAWSWTTDKDKAIWFAKRNYEFMCIAFEETQGMKCHMPSYVMSGIIKKKHILFEYNGRKESEVVIAGWRKNIWAEQPTIIQEVRECLNQEEKQKIIKQNKRIMAENKRIMEGSII